METEKKDLLSIQQPARDLVTFAFDRTDTKELLATIPENCHLNLTTIEYELQILKILSVGWGISFFTPDTNKNKAGLAQRFWDHVRETSDTVSTVTQTTTGQNIDYFDILKKRLDAYLAIMQKNQGDAQNPADIMGPAFADACNSSPENNAIANLIGTKMFTLTLGAVKEYLNSMKPDAVKLN